MKTGFTSPISVVQASDLDDNTPTEAPKEISLEFGLIAAGVTQIKKDLRYLRNHWVSSPASTLCQPYYFNAF